MPRQGLARVFLVPGFFGFSSLGSLNYFYRVERLLEERLRPRLAAHGLRCEVVPCATHPTGSLRARAGSLLDRVIELDRGGERARQLHFVGHSSGGLDARLLLSPGVEIDPPGSPRRRERREVARRSRSLVCLATPHHGTPLAAFFTTIHGREALRALAALAVTEPGRRSLLLGSQIASLLGALDDWTGRRRSTLDYLRRTLLRGLDLDPDNAIWRFLQDVARDQGVVLQLSPECMDLFDAAVPDRPGLATTCILACAPSGTRALIESRGWPPARAALAGLFAVLHAATARARASYPCPEPPPPLDAELRRLLGHPAGPSDNDGIVPLFSQVHGRCLGAFLGDHLDVVGQFRGAGGNPAADWLPSGSAFRQVAFERLWGLVAEEIAANARG